MKKSIVLFISIIYFVTLGIVLFFFRYSIIPTHGSLGRSYKLNRLTGEVTVLFGSRELPVQFSEKKADLSFLPDKPKSESSNEFADLIPDKKSESQKESGWGFSPSQSEKK